MEWQRTVMAGSAIFRTKSNCANLIAPLFILIFDNPVTNQQCYGWRSCNNLIDAAPNMSISAPEGRVRSNDSSENQLCRFFCAPITASYKSENLNLNIDGNFKRTVSCRKAVLCATLMSIHLLSCGIYPLLHRANIRI